MEDVLKKGEELFRQGSLEEARSCFLEIPEDNPFYPTACNNLGVIAYQQGRIEEAVLFFSRALASDLSYREALRNLGVALRTLGRLPEIASSLEAFHRRDPGDKEIAALLREAGEHGPYCCNICGWQGAQFMPTGPRPNARCPVCQSVERHRAFVSFLKYKDFYGKHGVKCLEISPPGPHYQKIMKSRFEYVTADLDSPLATYRMDLTDLKFPDNEFEFMICFHVLEHISDDFKAMQELHRCLHPRGMAIISVPFSPHLSATKEFGKPDPEQSMHVREYGADVALRLVKAGFDVEVVEALKYVPPEENLRSRMAGSLLLFICRK
jgi:tetratricopeptide (TPR) repeat protein